jgi:Raf kinase inhibitor-like YbhB/YbcL family protein
LTFQLKSPAFDPAGDIPADFTCDGRDRSPALQWNDPPDATQSLAVIVDDPDAPAGSWVHWVLYDLPSTIRDLPEGVPARGELSSGARQGRNDFREIGYGGPCPPHGPAHRYVFSLYALDVKTNLPVGALRRDLDRAMSGHILARAEYVGRYRR